MQRVIHFEINADKPERAAKFYEQVFGWQIKKWDGPMAYWMVWTGNEKDPGINGGIMQRVPGENTTNTMDVKSVDEFTKKIQKAGGKVTMPKTLIPNVGYFARCVDTEGNAFGIIENLPKDKIKMEKPPKSFNKAASKKKK